MGSWLSRAPIMLRDEGEGPFKGLRHTKDERWPDNTIRFHKGELVVDEITGDPVDPPRPARQQWPGKTGVYVNPRLTGEDLQVIDKLGRRSKALADEVKADDLDGLHNDLEGVMPAVIQLSVVVKGFACRIAKREDCASDEEFEECNLFEDPLTRSDYVGPDQEGTPGTGKILTMPDDIVARVKTIARLPAEVLGAVSSQYAEMQGNPLPGTRAVA